jgi:GNAT superfamily N-acetyltransferase
MLIQTTTWFLEMTSPDQLRPGRPPREGVTLARAEIPSAEFSRFLYRAVGGDWYWVDRLHWSYQEWQQWAARVETWAAYVQGTPAGYFELESRPDGNVHLALFGLLPWAIGQGLGGWLLTRAIERAWEREARIVTVNTCSLDGPYALTNYQARGFTLTRMYTATCNLPEQTPGPWRDANRPA